MSNEMTEEEFSELSAKEITGEASDNERELLKKICDQNSDYKETYDLIRASTSLIPMAEALDAGETENIPKELLNSLLSDKIKKEAVNQEPELIPFSEELENMPANFKVKPEGEEKVAACYSPNWEGKSEGQESSSFFWLPLAAAACVAAIYYTNSNDGEAQLVEEISKGDFKTTESSPFTDLNLEEEDVFAMVEFGVWKEDLLRGGNEESKENFPEGVRKVQLEKKIDWEMWKADKSVKYKVWIDEDYGTVKILSTESGQIETKQLNLLDDSQSSEFHEILKKLIQGIEK